VQPAGDPRLTPYPELVTFRLGTATMLAAPNTLEGRRAMTHAEMIQAVRKASRVYVGAAITEGQLEYFQVTKVEALFRLGPLSDAMGDFRCEVDTQTGSVKLGGK
jgi:hypothetical protein